MRPRLRSLLLVAIGGVLLVACSSSATDRGGASGPGSSSTSSSPSSVVSSTSAPSTSTSLPSGAVAPVGFRSVILEITRADGTVEQHCVWLADDEPSRETGLMGVTDPSLGGRDGMVFRFPADTTAAFWMRDTLLPLSIAWFAADGSFVSSTEMDPCPSGTVACPTFAAARPYRLALEVPRGGLVGLGIDERSRARVGGACPEGVSG